MRLSKNATLIKAYLQAHTMADIKDLMVLLNRSKPTTNRALSELEYTTSISHSGKYYSMKKSPKLNEYGMWIYKGVSFSSHGTLAETIQFITMSSAKGYTSRNLETILNISANATLTSLCRSSLLFREKFKGVYTYFSPNEKEQKSQLKQRRLLATTSPQVSSTSKNTSDEIKAYIIMFYCLLNEKQKRLYAGLEALRYGKGGDSFISDLLGLNIKTVAKGRVELEGDSVIDSSVRKCGGGRTSVKKNA